MLDAARRLAALGLPVFRLAPRTKTPLKGSHAYLDATTDDRTIHAWWSAMPDAMIAIACSPKTGLMAIDLDPRNGGIDAFRAFVGGRPLPRTWTVATPGGGYHAYFRHPGVRMRHEFLPGVECQANGHYCVAPPSVHPNGGTYRWVVAPDEHELAHAPDWLIEHGKQAERVLGDATGSAAESPLAAAFAAAGLLGRDLDDTRVCVVCPWESQHTTTNETGTILFAPTETTPYGTFFCSHTSHGPKRTRDVLDALGAQARLAYETRAAALGVGLRKLTRDNLGDVAGKMMRGSPRRKALARLLREVADGNPFAGDDRELGQVILEIAQEFPDLDPVYTAAYLGDADRFRWACGVAGQSNEAQALAEAQEKVAALAALGRVEPYTPAELAMVPGAFVVQHGPSYWIWTGERYAHVHGKAFRPAAVQWLAPAPVDLTNELGQVLGADDIVRKFGTVVETTVADLRATVARIEGSTFYDAPCPLRRVNVAFDANVDTFLRLLGGETYEALADWLAAVVDMSRPLPALALDGAAGAGKSLLAYGLAGLWGAEPIPLVKATQRFNAGILACPLAFGDETIPRQSNGDPDTESLREIIVRQAHAVERKGAEVSRAIGPLRVIVAANDLPRQLRSRGSLGHDDIKALSDRFLYLLCDERPVEWLATGTPGATDALRDAIPGHVWWLRSQGRPFVRGTRLAVPANCEALVRTLDLSSGPRYAVYAWIAGWLNDPRNTKDSKSEAIAVVRGDVLVRAEGIAKLWEHYVTDARPTMHTIAECVRQVCHRTDRRHLRRGAGRVWYRVVDQSRLIAFALSTGDDDLATRIGELSS